MDASALRGPDAVLVTYAFGVGETLYRQSIEDMHELGITTAVIAKTLKETQFHFITCATSIMIQRTTSNRQNIQETQMRSNSHPDPSHSQSSPFTRFGGVGGLACRRHDNRLTASLYINVFICLAGSSDSSSA